MSSTETFNRFLARQPILSPDRKFFAYEILSRYAPENYCRPTPGSPVAEKAMDELFLMGVRTITELIVGEILETVPPDEEVLSACYRMKDQGYRLALDDYCDLPEMQPFLAIADFVKIDVLLTTFAEQERLVNICQRREIPVVAEKVETDEQFRRCVDIGYDYFQGYFFCRPQVVERRGVPANKTVYLQLLQAANAPLFDLHHISMIFRRDVSLSYVCCDT